MGSAYVPVEIGCSVGKSTQIALPSGHLIADQLCVPLLLQQPWKAPCIFLSGWFSWKQRKEICSSLWHLHCRVFSFFLSLRNKGTLKINPDLHEEKFLGGLAGERILHLHFSFGSISFGISPGHQVVFKGESNVSRWWGNWHSSRLLMECYLVNLRGGQSGNFYKSPISRYLS